MDGHESVSAKTIAASQLAAALLGGTILAGCPAPRSRRTPPAAAGAAPPRRSGRRAAPQADVIRTIAVAGAQRLEPRHDRLLHPAAPGPGLYRRPPPTRRSRISTRPSCSPTSSIRNNGGDVVIDGGENPVINRIVLEGNKRIKDDKITARDQARRRGRSSPAPRSAPTSPASSSCTSARAASPPRSSRKMVELDQNRVDVVFEINEGPKSKVRADQHHRQRGVLRRRSARRDGHQGGAPARASSARSTSYDPDRLAFDQQKLRQFYLTEGYADFRVVSAVAELTPGQAGLHHHLRGRGRRALQVRRRRRSRASCATSTARR